MRRDRRPTRRFRALRSKWMLPFRTHSVAAALLTMVRLASHLRSSLAAMLKATIRALVALRPTTTFSGTATVVLLQPLSTLMTLPLALATPAAQLGHTITKANSRPSLPTQRLLNCRLLTFRCMHRTTASHRLVRFADSKVKFSLCVHRPAITPCSLAETMPTLFPVQCRTLPTTRCTVGCTVVKNRSQGPEAQ